MRKINRVDDSPAKEIIDGLEINVDDLVGSAIKQVKLMERLSVLLAEAQRKVGRATEKVKTVRSQLLLKLYRAPRLLGDGVNLNMQTAEAWYRSNEEYIEAVKSQIEKEYEASVLQSLMYTLAHRRSSLEIVARTKTASTYGDRDLPDTGIREDPLGYRSCMASVAKAGKDAKTKALQVKMSAVKQGIAAKAREIKKVR